MDTIRRISVGSKIRDGVAVVLGTSINLILKTLAPIADGPLVFFGICS